RGGGKEGNRGGGQREVAARMGMPRRFDRLLLIDAIAEADVGSALDESPDADCNLGLAILAAHQQVRFAVARRERRRDERAVVERRFFIADDPGRLAARPNLAPPGG